MALPDFGSDEIYDFYFLPYRGTYTCFVDFEGYYNYVLFDGPSEFLSGMLALLPTLGVHALHHGQSFHRANNGVQYDWYVRVEPNGFTAEALTDYLAGLFASLRPEWTDVQLNECPVNRKTADDHVAPELAPERVLELERELAEARNRGDRLKARIRALQVSQQLKVDERDSEILQARRTLLMERKRAARAERTKVNDSSQVQELRCEIKNLKDHISCLKQQMEANDADGFDRRYEELQARIEEVERERNESREGWENERTEFLHQIDNAETETLKALEELDKSQAVAEQVEPLEAEIAREKTRRRAAERRGAGSGVPRPSLRDSVLEIWPLVYPLFDPARGTDRFISTELAEPKHLFERLTRLHHQLEAGTKTGAKPVRGVRGCRIYELAFSTGSGNRDGRLYYRQTSSNRYVVEPSLKVYQERVFRRYRNFSPAEAV